MAFHRLKRCSTNAGVLSCISTGVEMIERFYVDVEGRQMHYRRAGSGMPLLHHFGQDLKGNQ